MKTARVAGQTLPGGVSQRWISLFALTGILLCLAGCGYRFVERGTLPGSIRSVAVPMIENRTAETGVEHLFTNDLIYEFTRNGNNIASPEKADAVLTGGIRSISIETVSYRGQIAAVERRVKAVLDLKLVDRDGAILWSAPDVEETETYGVLDEKVATDYNKRVAIQLLSERLAEKVYQRLTEEQF